MSERKVLNKYYPPDYNPDKVPRVKRKSKQNDVRTMLPFNLRCNTCGENIACATKFNAKKEAVEDETYKGVTIYRFYIKCTRCMATIIFRTNPKDQGYEVEHGATENFRALKLAERQAREEADAEEEEEKINPMKHLENRTKASKRQMEASEQIQNLRSIKYRYHNVDLDAVIQSKRDESEQDSKLAIEYKPDDIRSEAMKLFKKRALDQEPGSSALIETKPTPKIAQSSSLKVSSALSSLKKKIKIVPKTQPDIEGNQSKSEKIS